MKKFLKFYVSYLIFVAVVAVLMLAVHMANRYLPEGVGTVGFLLVVMPVVTWIIRNK